MKTKQTDPVKYPVTFKDDTITCRIAFDGGFYEKFPKEDKTYADLCKEGIRKYWSEGGFTVELIEVPKDDPQPHVNVVPAKLTGTSYVMSRWWRWGWGLFRSSFHPESVMINWSRKHPGNIHLNLRSKSSVDWFMRVSAHEFGHILGLGDAYAAHYRFYYEAPGTRDYMMNSNRKVSPEEADMVRKAQATGKMQYFPIRFSAKRYFKKLLKR